MNQYKLGQLGKVWSMMSRHPEVLLINIVRVVISSQLPGLFLGSEKQWYFNQKPIKIGWVCRGGLFIVAFSKKVIWIWERGGKNRRGHQSPLLHCLTDARISIDNWQAFNICPIEQSRLCNFWDWWIVRLLYQSYHTTTGLTMEPTVYVTTMLRRLLQVRENYIWIWYSNITVEYYCHVWIMWRLDEFCSQLFTYLLFISWPSNLKSNSVGSVLG